ncbi:hypothetical protein C5167_040428, partial [Papaver somniferum]
EFGIFGSSSSLKLVVGKIECHQDNMPIWLSSSIAEDNTTLEFGVLLFISFLIKTKIFLTEIEKWNYQTGSCVIKNEWSTILDLAEDSWAWLVIMGIIPE